MTKIFFDGQNFNIADCSFLNIVMVHNLWTISYGKRTECIQSKASQALKFGLGTAKLNSDLIMDKVKNLMCGLLIDKTSAMNSLKLSWKGQIFIWAISNMYGHTCMGLETDLPRTLGANYWVCKQGSFIWQVGMYQKLSEDLRPIIIQKRILKDVRGSSTGSISKNSTIKNMLQHLWIS